MNVEEEVWLCCRNALLASGAIMAIAYRVYDKVHASPYGDKTAYIALAAMDASEDDADCIIGARITMQIDIWSKADGSHEARQLTNLVRKALHHKSLALTDNALVDTHVELWRVFADPADGITHGVVTVTAMVEESD